MLGEQKVLQPLPEKTKWAKLSRKVLFCSYVPTFFPLPSDVLKNRMMDITGSSLLDHWFNCWICAFLIFWIFNSVSGNIPIGVSFYHHTVSTIAGGLTQLRLSEFTQISDVRVFSRLEQWPIFEKVQIFRILLRYIGKISADEASERLSPWLLNFWKPSNTMVSLWKKW